jgi:hypothetical protein
MKTRALAAAVIIAAGLAAGCGSPGRPHAGVPAEGGAWTKVIVLR